MSNKNKVELTDASTARPVWSVDGEILQNVRNGTGSPIQEKETLSRDSARTTYSLFSPSLHVQFFNFKFLNHVHKFEDNPDNLKSVLENGLTQIAVVAALIMSVESSFILTLRGEIQKTSALRIAFAFSVFLSFVILTLTVCWAVFYILMINSCASVDEMVLWVNTIVWRITLPHQMFTLGIWSEVLSFVLYLFTVTSVEIASGICSGAFIMYLSFTCN